MSSKTELVEKFIADVTRSHEKMKKQVSSLSDQLERDIESANEMMRRLGDMVNAERSSNLQTALTAVANGWAHIRNSNTEFDAQLRQNILPHLKGFDAALAAQKSAALMRKKQAEQLSQTTKKLNEAKAKSNTAAVTELEHRHAVEFEAMAKAESDFNTALLEFEALRIGAIKHRMTATLRAQLVFHTKSIDALSQALLSLGEVDPITEAQSLWSTLAQYDARDGVPPPAPQPMMSLQQPMPMSPTAAYAPDAVFMRGSASPAPLPGSPRPTFQAGSPRPGQQQQAYAQSGFAQQQGYQGYPQQQQQQQQQPQQFTPSSPSFAHSGFVSQPSRGAAASPNFGGHSQAHF